MQFHVRIEFKKFITRFTMSSRSFLSLKKKKCRRLGRVFGVVIDRTSVIARGRWPPVSQAHMPPLLIFQKNRKSIFFMISATFWSYAPSISNVACAYSCGKIGDGQCKQFCVFLRDQSVMCVRKKHRDVEHRQNFIFDFRRISVPTNDQKFEYRLLQKSPAQCKFCQVSEKNEKFAFRVLKLL